MSASRHRVAKLHSKLFRGKQLTKQISLKNTYSNESGRKEPHRDSSQRLHLLPVTDGRLRVLSRNLGEFLRARI